MSEIFLHPGEFYFGPAPARIKTILGSCVAVTLWHPTYRLGGMCHIMLPSRSCPLGTSLDGRYADEAVERFVHELEIRRIDPATCRIKLFGGGNMFEGRAACIDVGERNIKATREALASHRFSILAEYVGGVAFQRLSLDIGTGRVLMYSPNGRSFDSLRKFDAQDQNHACR